jgi:cytochrome c biogenesis protein CcmG/thiol:disulfide interchange protein DsbE
VVPALFIALIAYGLFKTTAPKAVVGAPAPRFSLKSIDGRTRISNADFRGTPVVVNFWASWCVSCPEETADLERMWKEYGPKGVRFLGVTYDEDVDAARGFVERYGLTYPTVHDPDKRLATGFGVRGVPETYFIDGGARADLRPRPARTHRGPPPPAGQGAEPHPVAVALLVRAAIRHGFSGMIT